MTTTIDSDSLHTVLRDTREIEDRLLPQLDACIWDLALRYASLAPELVEAQELADVLETSVRLHLDEDAAFALEAIGRLAGGAALSEAELDRLPRTVRMLTPRFDRLNAAVAELRELLIAAHLPESAEDEREQAIDALDEIALLCARHDALERDRLFPQADAAVHARLVAALES